MSSRLHRTSGKAVGTGSTITLKGTACYRIVNRSTVHSLRLTAIESGNSYLFPRDVLFGDAAEGSCGVRQNSVADLAGLFAGYVGTRTVSMAAA